MKGPFQFIRTTIIGGLVFLVPVVLIALILGKALNLSRMVTQPIAARLPFENLAGIAIANLVGGFLVFVVCLLAGLAARTSLAHRFVRESETHFLWSLPGYSFIRGLTDSLSREDAHASMIPVLTKLEDGSRLAFEIERLEDGRVVVYLPDAPDIRTGEVKLLDANRVESLPITMIAAVQNIRGLGRGTRLFLEAHPEVAKA